MSFVVVTSYLHRPSRLTIALATSASNNGDANAEDRRQQHSRLEGNARPPTQQEIEVMDTMIDKLMQAKPYELPAAVQRAFRVLRSPQFFLRIAERQDVATSRSQKEQLQALASNLVATLEAVVSTTQDRLEERAKLVEKIVKAAAEPDSGEFLVPLSWDRRKALQAAIQAANPADLDEAFLTTLDAYMNKSHAGGMDLMVNIFQKVLQYYAGLVIGRARGGSDDDDSEQGAGVVVQQLLDSDPDQWDDILQQAVVPLSDVQAKVQRTMETVVLQLDAGSMSQRVQAEYLQELVKRIEAIQKRK